NGADRLSGGDGSDVLHGGRGDDVLTGGPGADIFSVLPGSDQLVDYTPSDGDTKDEGGIGTYGLIEFLALLIVAAKRGRRALKKFVRLIAGHVAGSWRGVRPKRFGNAAAR
ncbi:MAG TPA: hypothetical protein VFO36_12405, partial [Nitrospiraceae bacterium]|nr:hypothetical protein [Nitrospiraceae bacterium]